MEALPFKSSISLVTVKTQEKDVQHHLENESLKKAFAMGPNKTETATVFPNTTRSVFYCSHAPHIIWDLQDTTSPWIISPPAALLNALIIIAVKRRRELKRTSNILLSSLAVTDLLVGSLCVPLSAVVGLLVSYQVLTDYYIACWTLLRYRPRSFSRFVRFSI